MLNLTMILGILFIVFSWSVIIIILTGIGLPVLHFVKAQDIRKLDLFVAFWIGWALTIGILQIWHLFAPINGLAAIGVGLVGIIGLITNRKKLCKLLSINQQQWLWVFLVGVFAIWLANRAMAPNYLYDTGLYHLQTILWNKNYPIIPGLGNLHVRLAYNSSYFLFLSLLDGSLWSDKSHLLGSSLLIFVVTLQISAGVLRAIYCRASLQVHEIFQSLMWIPLLNLFFNNASSTSPDVPIFILGMLIYISLSQFIYDSLEAWRGNLLFFFVLVLASVGITIKHTFLVFGLTASIVTTLHYFQGEPPTLTKGLLFIKATKIKWAFIIPTIILISWFLRNIILSGYLIFPINFISFNLDWRIPKEEVVYHNKGIASWARNPDPNVSYEEVLSNWDWLDPWTERIIKSWREILLPLSMFFIGITLCLFRWRNDRRPILFDFLFLLCPLLWLIFWFFTAPDIRFAGSAFWLLGAGALSLALDGFQKPPLIQNTLLIYLVLSAVILGGLLQQTGLFTPPPNDGIFYPFPAVIVRTFVTNSGLVINVPEQGEQCWNVPIPCSPYRFIGYPLTPNLRLREDQDFSSGFTQQP